MVDTNDSVLTRSGCRIASDWATTPPVRGSEHVHIRPLQCLDHLGGVVCHGVHFVVLIWADLVAGVALIVGDCLQAGWEPCHQVGELRPITLGPVDQQQRCARTFYDAWHRSAVSERDHDV
nr:hypothetical protein [Williamsia sp. D3]